MSDEPIRLIDDPAVSDALRADLRSVIDHPPAIPLPADPPAMPPKPSLLGPLAAGALVLGLLGYGLFRLTAGDPAPTREPAATAAEPEEAAEAPEPAAEVPEPAAEVPEPAAEAPEAAAEAPEAASAPEAATVPEPASAPREADAPAQRSRATEAEGTSLSDEIAHMAELRRIAERDPRRALAMARAGERRFAAGLFGEERQALIVLSLDRLGRESAARSAASRFLRRHPQSTFRDRIAPIAEGAGGSR